MAGHTPGPWFRDTSGDTAYGIYAKDEHGTRFPVIVWRGIARAKSPTGKANARLIAAAPDLLEALKAILHWRVPHDDVLTVTDGSREAIARGRGAIAKATGEA